MTKELYVHLDIENVSHYIGKLWIRAMRDKESASFEYDKTWLEHPSRFALEPALPLLQGGHHTLVGHALFGAMGDSAPDRWGRLLIQREERRQARTEKRTMRSLSEGDYLLAVGDFSRQGALRFSRAQQGEFLAPQNQKSIPPMLKLGALLQASLRVTADEEDDDDLKLVLAPGSSLGGARAKASVLDTKGALWIAKFPQHDDAWPVILWEAVALDLAEKAGIWVPQWQLKIVQKKPVLLLKRFDRHGNQRIPFLSAMSMLGAKDNEEHSYLEIVDALRKHGKNPERDSAQLWRRLLFNMRIANTDDHLRNHGFLYQEGGWNLSPAYDMNPMPTDVKPRYLSLAANETNNIASRELAHAVASHFGVSTKEAKRMETEIDAAVSTWRKCAKKYGLKPRATERMESAFEWK